VVSFRHIAYVPPDFFPARLRLAPPGMRLVLWREMPSLNQVVEKVRVLYLGDPADLATGMRLTPS
jgi:hypothetical protein